MMPNVPPGCSRAKRVAARQRLERAAPRSPARPRSSCPVAALVIIHRHAGRGATLRYRLPAVKNGERRPEGRRPSVGAVGWPARRARCREDVGRARPSASRAPLRPVNVNAGNRLGGTALGSVRRVVESCCDGRVHALAGAPFGAYPSTISPSCSRPGATGTSAGCPGIEATCSVCVGKANSTPSSSASRMMSRFSTCRVRNSSFQLPASMKQYTRMSRVTALKPWNSTM